MKPEYGMLGKPEILKWIKDKNKMNQPQTPDNAIPLNTGSPQDRAIVRELIHLRCPNLEFRSHERDSNYRWEKIAYGTGATEINWAYWEFRLLGCLDLEPHNPTK